MNEAKTVTAEFRRVTVCDSTSSNCSDEAKRWTHEFYTGYYGRCAECGGFQYWCTKIEEAMSQVPEGGELDLTPIITPFGTSEEYTTRFGGLSDSELVHKLYTTLI